MEKIEYVVNGVINNFDFTYIFIVNVVTYIIIKLIDHLNGIRIVPTWQKRLILVAAILAICIIYIFIGYDNDIKLLNSAILAPIAWTWIIKPIFKKMGIDYKQIDDVLN